MDTNENSEEGKPSPKVQRRRENNNHALETLRSNGHYQTMREAYFSPPLSCEQWQLMLFIQDNDKKNELQRELPPIESRRVILAALYMYTLWKQKKIAPPVLMSFDKVKNLITPKKQVKVY